MHLLVYSAMALHGTLGLLMICLSALALGAFTFTFVQGDGDSEVWSFVSLIGDTVGTLTFRNPDYKRPPFVTLVPIDTSAYLDSMFIGTAGLARTSCVVTQAAAISAGAGRVLVRRNDG